MKFRGLVVVGMLAWSAAAPAEDAGVALAQRSVCLACHQVDTKRVGPSFRDIALRYAGNEAAAEYLARTIRDGSRGLWGAIPMPAQRHVDPATALLLGEWIMSLAPEPEHPQDLADEELESPTSSAAEAASSGKGNRTDTAAPRQTGSSRPAMGLAEGEGS